MSTLGRATGAAVRMMAVTAALVASGVGLFVLVEGQGANASRDAGSRTSDAAQPAAVDGLVKLDRDDQEKGGIETEVPTPRRYQDQIRVTGTVLALDRLTALYNEALTDAARLREAEVKAAGSRLASQRAQELLKVFSTAKAQAEAASAASDLDAAALGLVRAQDDTLRNTAIQEWGATLGAAIADRSKLAEDLVLRRTCLVQITVPPGARLAPPPHIALALDSGGSVTADYVSAATQVDPRLQSGGFLYVAAARPALLVGASLLAMIPTGEASAGIPIPPKAVVWDAGKAWVYVREGTDAFRREALDGAATLSADGGYLVPATSLPHDPALVVSGAQTLLSQETRAQIPADEDDQ